MDLNIDTTNTDPPRLYEVALETDESVTIAVVEERRGRRGRGQYWRELTILDGLAVILGRQLLWPDVCQLGLRERVTLRELGVVAAAEPLPTERWQVSYRLTDWAGADTKWRECEVEAYTEEEAVQIAVPRLFGRRAFLHRRQILSRLGQAYTYAVEGSVVRFVVVPMAPQGELAGRSS